MRLRAVIFEDEPSLCRILGFLCERRGYEAFAFPDPAHPPFGFGSPCPCPRGAGCADLLLVDRYMLATDGLDFVEGLRAKGCLLPHIAPLSGVWPPADRARALQLGCRPFPKPFSIVDILAWFDTVEVQVDPTRTLPDWRGEGWQIGRPPPGA